MAQRKLMREVKLHKEIFERDRSFMDDYEEIKLELNERGE